MVSQAQAQSVCEIFPNSTGGATAAGAFAFACGQDANANGNEAAAIGDSANAVGNNTTAVGNLSNAGANNATAVGKSANASAIDATAVGQFARATGVGATAVGQSSFASGLQSTAFGQSATAHGDLTTALGASAGIGSNDLGGNTWVGANAGQFADGANNTAIGLNAGQDVTGNGNFAGGFGAGHGVDGTFNTALGFLAGQAVNGDRNTAIGLATGREVGGDDNVALGNNAGANHTFNDTIAIGRNSVVGGHGAIAIGQDTIVQMSGGVAIGVDSGGTSAISTRENQFMFGTANHTYTAPGITSDESRALQSGPLQVVTSDADGNLATHPFLFATLDEHDRRLNEHTSGIALAMSMQNPDLVGAERFGIAGSWGTFEGAHALSVSVMGVVGYDVFSPGDRIAVSGGFGAGFGHKSGRSVYGGRAGVQWTW